MDINPSKFERALAMGATETVNPMDHGDKPVQQVIVDMTDGGVCTLCFSVCLFALNSPPPLFADDVAAAAMVSLYC